MEFTMNSAKRVLLGFVWVLGGLLAPSLVHADLEITVSGGTTQAKPIAVVPFAGNEGTEDVAKVIEADLERSGLFQALPRGDMLEKPNEPSQIDYRNWRTVNRDNLVMGSLFQDPATDNLVARFFLMDVVRGEQLLGFDMPAVPAKQLRYIGHQIADLIYEKLTGIKGVFNTKIAYVTASGYGSARTFQLVVADADGEFPRIIATSREPLMSPSWAPDRKRLAYVGYDRGNQAIFIHELASGSVRKITAETGINGSPAWSPDGRSLALTLSYGRNPDIYVVDVQSGAKHRLTDHYGIDTEPSWSPDGQSIVYTSERGGQPQIYRIPAAGGASERLTFEGKQNLRASYAPDGKSIVVVNYDESVYRIAVMDLETRRMKMLSDGPLDEGASFAPNGAVVIYARQTGHGAELATVTIDGRVRQRLAQTGDVREPAWSPLAQ